MNEPVSHDVETQLRELMAAPDANEAFVSRLRSRLIAGSKAKAVRRVSPRLAWAGAFALVLLLAGLLASSPQMAAAMRRILAYIPGVGFVESGPDLRILAEPVTVQKDGLTLTIEEGAADAQRTVLLARVNGYDEQSSGPQSCTDPLRLVLADGRVLETHGISGSSDAQHPGIVFMRYELEPMPSGVLDGTLVIRCLMFDARYPGWTVPLRFELAREGQAAPVIELPSQPAAMTVTPAGAASPEPAPAGFAVTLEGAAELEDGYLLSGSYQWSDAGIDRYAVAISHSNIVDAHGRDVPYREVEADAVADADLQEVPFAYEIAGKEHAWPLTLTVNTISVVQPGYGIFEFDAGADPRVGQTWDVDIDVPIGQHVIHVQKIELKGGPPGMPEVMGFEFTMTSDRTVASALVEDLHPVIHCTGECGGGGGGGSGGADFGVSGFDGAAVPFVHGWAMQGYQPGGLKTFAISNMSVFFQGPWQATWQPSPP